MIGNLWIKIGGNLTNEYINNKTFESTIQSFQTLKRQRKKYELIVADLKETHERRILKYEDNLKHIPFQEKLSEYNKICNDFNDCQNLLAAGFYILSENIANYAKFSGIDIDDAIQEGVLICFEKVDRFNPNYRGANGQKAKAFNYCTTCILNNMRQLYRSARNYHELKKKYQVHLQNKLETLFYKNGKEMFLN